MKPIPDFAIYLAGLTSTVFFVFCGIYFVSNKFLGIWALFGGIIFGLLTGFLYWHNDISKTQASKFFGNESQKTEVKNVAGSTTTSIDKEAKAREPVLGKAHNEQTRMLTESEGAGLPDKRSSVAVIIERLDSGALEWPKDPAKYSYILLEMEVFNLEDHAIPLPAEPFELSATIKGRLISFKKVFIPLSGTVLYKDSNDRSGSNIDHVDLQKFRELNTSRLYGHYDPSAPKQAKYLQSKHYILFLTTEVAPEVIHEMLVSGLKKERLPLRLTWRDVRNYMRDCHLTTKEARVTSNCYKVYIDGVKFYKPQ